jgi:hypothetical protein
MSGVNSRDFFRHIHTLKGQNMTDAKATKQEILNLCDDKIKLAMDRLRFEIEKRRDYENMTDDQVIIFWSAEEQAQRRVMALMNDRLIENDDLSNTEGARF